MVYQRAMTKLIYLSNWVITVINELLLTVQGYTAITPNNITHCKKIKKNRILEALISNLRPFHKYIGYESIYLLKMA
ncbi:MAG: hypothetical protein ACOX69_05445 [Coriobacteriales bacterium]|jgi:hypothetical protein